MKKTPPRRYVAAAVVAVGFAIVGMWLPWVQKLPVGTIEGGGVAYTMEGIPELEAGFESFDLFVLVPVLFTVVVGAVAASRGRSWWTDAVLAAMGSALLWVAGNSYIGYYTTERYAAQPGVYLVLVAGLLLFLIGAGGFLTGLASDQTEQAAT
jgi:cation transport ATPase